MSRVDAWRVVLRSTDLFALLWVVGISSSSILNNDYGDAVSGGPAVRWYLMAALYAGASWIARSAPASSVFRCFACINLLLVAHACFQSAYRGYAEALASSPVAWFDWLILGLCSAGSAASRWILRNENIDSSTF